MLDAPLPDLILYGRPGCNLCEEARQLVTEVLAARRRAGLTAPALVERNIEMDPAWQRDFLEIIPVVELGEQRVDLVTSAARIRRLISDALDA